MVMPHAAAGVPATPGPSNHLPLPLPPSPGTFGLTSGRFQSGMEERKAQARSPGFLMPGCRSVKWGRNSPDA